MTTLKEQSSELALFSISLRPHLPPDSFRDSCAGPLHLFQVRAFHHHARQRLGSGKAHQYAARSGESLFHKLDLTRYGGKLRQPLFFPHAHVDQTLGVDFEVGRQLIQARAGPAIRAYRHPAGSRRYAVANCIAFGSKNSALVLRKL